MSVEAIIEYARRIRERRRAGPSNLEQALAPEFQRLLESLLPLISSNELVVVPEFATPGIGRPDIALKRAGQPPRAFIELKAPTKPGDPSRYRDPHDKQQFERFKSLPVWAISNFSSLRVFRRHEAIDSVEIVPEAALEPETTDVNAERLIRRGDPAALIAGLTPLALADPPPAADAMQLAGNWPTRRGSFGPLSPIDSLNSPRPRQSERRCRESETSSARCSTRIRKPPVTARRASKRSSPPPLRKRSGSVCCWCAKPPTETSTATHGETCRPNTLCCARRFAC